MKIERVIRWLFMFSALWGVIGGLLTFFFGGGTRVTVIAIPGEPSEQIVEHLNWFESQGWWGIFILLVFAALFYSPLRFYGHGKKLMAALFTLAAIVLTILSGFSVGPIYLPGALGAFFGLILLPLDRQPNASR
ncbi:MAG: hypothetical protein ACRDFQ_01710 [Anaerolineales bacterium]